MNLAVLRCLSAGMAAAIVGLAGPAAADTMPGADVGRPEVVTYRAPSNVELPRFETAQPQRASSVTLTRVAMYVAQAVDAAQSGRAFARGGIERNPMMRPFSHAGALGMAAGFAIGDLIRGAALRRSSDTVKVAADTAQAAGNLEGILATRASLGAARLP